MAKFIFQRLLIIPFLLLLVNFLGFTYAHYARPIRAARTPYVQVEEAGPLIPEYLDYGAQQAQQILTPIVQQGISQSLGGPTRLTPREAGSIIK